MLARCLMLMITFASRSLGESVPVLEPEEFFPYPVAGTHEGGGHAGVGPLGGMWSPAWPEAPLPPPPPKPSSHSQGGTRRAGGQTVGSVAVGETEAQGPVTPTPPWPAFLVLGSLLPVQGALSGWHHPGACPGPAGQLCACRQEQAEPSALRPGLGQVWGGLGAVWPGCLSFPSGRSRRAAPSAHLVQGWINRVLKTGEGHGWPVCVPSQSLGQAQWGSPVVRAGVVLCRCSGLSRSHQQRRAGMVVWGLQGGGCNPS